MSEISPLVAEIIIGAIAVAFAIFLFGGFALPFLEFLADQDAITAFNEFSNGLSQSCKEGIYTVPYFNLAAQNVKKIYFIGTAKSTLTETILNLPECGSAGEIPCTTKASKSRIEACKTETCYCVFKMKYNTDLNAPVSATNEIPPYCPSYNFDVVTVEDNKLDDWYSNFSSTITSAGKPIESLMVLQCQPVSETSCVDKNNAVVLPKINERVIVWIQPNITKIKFLGVNFVYPLKLKLDSISFQMPTTGAGVAGRVEVVSNPTLDVYEYNCSAGAVNPIADANLKCYI